MTGPFPRRVRVPPGLATKQDTVMGLPRLVWLVLFGAVVMPPAFLGRIGLFLEPITLGVGIWIAMQAKDDPQFLLTISGSMGLKPYYE